MKRTSATAVVAAVCMLFVAGCGSSGSSVSPTATTPAASTTRPAPSGPSTTAPSSQQAPSAPPSTGGGTPGQAYPGTRCRGEDLRLDVGQTQGAAGNRYLELFLTNTGAAPCTLYGYPGVSVVDAAGKQIGKSADREPGHPEATVTLGADGGQARFMVHTTAGTGGEPCAAPAPVIRVIPPNTTTVLEAAHPLTICGDTFGVTPVSAPDADPS